MSDNLLGMPETQLPPDPAASRLLAIGSSPGQEELQAVAAAHPASCAAWAALAEDALARDDAVVGYAFARVGYHRGLDALRRAGWRGRGAVPWQHEPNRGFLRSLAALGRAARAVGESEEEARCAAFLRECSREAAEALGF